VIQEVQLLRDKEKQGGVVLGGFSQGCAMAVMVILSGELQRLNVKAGSDVVGFVGMSGWLPFRRQFSFLPSPSYMKAVQYTRELLGLEMLVLSEDEVERMTRCKIWLGTGQDDEKVKPEWGREMRDVLSGLGVDVHFKTYEGLGHWWCEEERGGLGEVLCEMFK